MDEINRAELAVALKKLIRQYKGNLANKWLPGGSASLENLPDHILAPLIDILLADGVNPNTKAATIAAIKSGNLKGVFESALSSFDTRDQVLKLIASLQGQPPDIELDGAKLFCRKGKLALESDRLREAQAFFAKATEIKPDYKASWIGLAEVLEKLGQNEKAQVARQRAEQL